MILRQILPRHLQLAGYQSPGLVESRHILYLNSAAIEQVFVELSSVGPYARTLL